MDWLFNLFKILQNQPYFLNLQKQVKAAVFLNIDNHFQKNMAEGVNHALINLRSSVLASSHQFSFESSSFEAMSKKEKKKIESGIENGLYISRLHKKFIVAELSYTGLILVTIVMLILYVQSSIQQAEKGILTEQEKIILLWIQVFVQIALILSALIRFDCRRVMASERKQSKTGKLLLGFEIFCLIFSPFPFLQENFLGEIPLNQILVILSVPKLIFLFRGLLNIFSDYSQPRSYRISRFYNIQNDYLLKVKWGFRDHPFITSSCLFFTSIFYFGYCVRIIQSNFAHSPFKHFENCIWFVMTTMTTVGYGDLMPVNIYSKVIALMSGFSGILSISLLILWLTSYISMNNREQRSLVLLNRIQTRKLIKTKAGYVIRYTLWRKWKSYKLGIQLKYSAVERKAARQFAKARQSITQQTEMETGFETFFQQNMEECQSILFRMQDNQNRLVYQLSQAIYYSGEPADAPENSNLLRTEKKAKQKILFKEPLVQDYTFQNEKSSFLETFEIQNFLSQKS